MEKSDRNASAHRRSSSSRAVRALLLSAIPAACVCPNGCASASPRPPASNDHGIAWRLDASQNVAAASQRRVRTVVLTLGVGDRLGAQREDVRIARAATTGTNVDRQPTPPTVVTGSER